MVVWLGVGAVFSHRALYMLKKNQSTLETLPSISVALLIIFTIGGRTEREGSLVCDRQNGLQGRKENWKVDRISCSLVSLHTMSPVGLAILL